MKLAFAKDIEFIKRTCGKSPAEYEQEIIAKFEPDFKFGGFILPWAGAKTYYRLHNPETGEFKDYQINKIRQTNGGEMLQTEKAVWLKMKRKCAQKGKRFDGWDGEWKGRNKTKAVCVCLEHNEIMKPSLIHALKDNFDFDCKRCRADKSQFVRSGGRTREDVLAERQSSIIERCKVKNYTFLGFAGDMSVLKDTHFKVRCNNHGVEWDSELRRGDSFTCPDCIKDQLVKLTNRTYEGTAHFYIQLLDDKYIKFGITTRDPIIRMREQERKSNFDHKLIFTHQFNEGWKAADIEHEIKNRFKCYAAPYKDFKDGWSETLDIDELPNLQQLVYDYLTNEPEESDMWVSPKDVFDEDTFEMKIHFYGNVHPYQFSVNSDDYYAEEEIEQLIYNFL
ncbi:TPA: hypothetical protein H1V70_000138 [Salmonella enterica]|nr:hypothetical protein [Salmonella enterica]